MKMTSPLLAAAAACVVVASPLRAADEKPAPPPAVAPAKEAPAPEKPKTDEKSPADFSKLDKTIAYAVEALEKKDFEGFFRNLTDPDTLKDMADQGHPVETLVKQVDAEVARQLLDAFHAVKDVKPKMEEDGNKATYVIPEDVVKEKKLRAGTLVFERIENHWYLTN